VGALAVLYDQQMSNQGTLTDYATSQNFESAFDQFDTQAADDFVVPANVGWTINTVEVLGVYDSSGSQTVSSVNVWFYANAGANLPSTQVYNATIAPSSGGSTGNFVLNLPSPPTLGPGHYWLSIQANLNSTRQWFWRENTALNNSASAWQNPGGGNSSHLGQCLSWGARQATCHIGNYPDLLFKLDGNVIVFNNFLYLPLIVRGP